MPLDDGGLSESDSRFLNEIRQQNIENENMELKARNGERIITKLKHKDFG